MTAALQTELGELRVVAETDEITAVCIEGEWDLCNAPQITEAGKRLLADNKQVILDLSAATFIDCAVIHALIDVQAKAQKNGGVVVLQLGTAPIVERVIEISKIERLLTRVSSRQEALDAIQGRDRAA